MRIPSEAEAMSLAGTKWEGTRAMRSRSHTLSTPIFLKASIAMGAVMSLAIARLTFAMTRSPGRTRSVPLARARIFSVMVLPYWSSLAVLMSGCLDSLDGGDGDRPVDGVEVRPGRPLDDVGGDGPPGVEVAVVLDPDADLAEGVGAPGHGADVERDESGVEAHRSPDGTAGGVDHPVAERCLLDDLAVVLDAHRGRGGEVRPAGHLDRLERVDVLHLGDLVGDDGDEVGIGEGHLAVHQVTEACPGPVEVLAGQLVAQVGQRLGEGVAAGVLAQDDAVGLPADGRGVHDLVRRAFHQHAVGVDAGLVGEGVGADDGLVWLHRVARQHGDQPGRADDLFRVHPGRDAERRPPGVDGHDDLLDRAVARPLADAVDGTLDLPGPR